SGWLPYALLTALALAFSLFTVRVGRPSRATVIALAALFALAALDALSIVWSPVPALARDEALLVLCYAAAFALAMLTTRTPADRAYAIGALAAGSGVSRSPRRSSCAQFAFRAATSTPDLSTFPSPSSTARR